MTTTIRRKNKNQDQLFNKELINKIQIKNQTIPQTADSYFHKDAALARCANQLNEEKIHCETVTIKPAVGANLRIKTFAAVNVAVTVLECRDVGSGFLMDVKMINAKDVDDLRKAGVIIKGNGFDKWIAFDFQIIQ